MATRDAFAQVAFAFTDPLQHENEISRPIQTQAPPNLIYVHKDCHNSLLVIRIPDPCGAYADRDDG
jgi:hypothetical protein